MYIYIYIYIIYTNLPNSSRRTKECSVACWNIVDVSLSSTKNVLSPGNINTFTSKIDIKAIANKCKPKTNLYCVQN